MRPLSLLLLTNLFLSTSFTEAADDTIRPPNFIVIF